MPRQEICRQAHLLDGDHLAVAEHRRLLRHLRLQHAITHYIGRKPAFAISFVLAAIATAVTFWFLDTFGKSSWMIPIMGFCQLALFGGYAIYFPELFPTRLRSTGTSFCYNVGRLVAAAGPSVLGLLTSRVYAGYHEPHADTPA